MVCEDSFEVNDLPFLPMKFKAILPGINGAYQGTKELEPSFPIAKVPSGLVISWGVASGAATGAAIKVVARAAARAKYLTNILKSKECIGLGFSKGLVEEFDLDAWS